MTIKYNMRFQLMTLVDITETKARKGDDNFKQKQQQNYLTAVQTISLRANPVIKNSPTVKELSVKDLGFGSNIKGNHNVWFLNFEFEYDAHNQEQLIKDFDAVPIIDNLCESLNLKIPAFLTNGSPERNTVFKKID
jgi:hypothetical protein